MFLKFLVELDVIFFHSNFAFKYLKATNQHVKMSRIRQNYHEDCEALINKQINMELHTSYVYMSMKFYFSRDDVAYPGFSKYFGKNSDEEREHAQKFMDYQNDRGFRIVLKNIEKPSKDEWGSPLEAIEAALELEKTVNQSILDMHGVASAREDPHLCDFLETHFLTEQVEAIKELSDWATKLKGVGAGLGEHIIDGEIGA